jgi:hypothetical protein
LLTEHMQGQAFQNIGSDLGEPGPATAVEPGADVPDGAVPDPDYQNGRVIDFVRRKQD